MHPIVGCWTTDPTDHEEIRMYGRVSLSFSPGGALEYTIHEDGKRQIIWLTYRIEGEEIVTDQPSNPREERTRFAIVDDRLYLSLGGGHGRYVRVPTERPPES